MLTNVPYFWPASGSVFGVLPGRAAHDDVNGDALPPATATGNGQLYTAESYDAYLDGIEAVFRAVAPLVAPGGTVVAMCENVRDAQTGRLIPQAWDVARRLGRVFDLQEEIVLCHPHEQSAQGVANGDNGGLAIGRDVDSAPLGRHDDDGGAAGPLPLHRTDRRHEYALVARKPHT